MSDVKLLVYDLSKTYGNVEWWTSWLPGPKLNGIWHTSLVLYGKEIDYGQKGVIIRDQGEEKDEPVKIYDLGFTKETYRTILGFVEMLNRTQFQGKNYNVVKNNCHCFTNTVVKNILKKQIPEYLRNLPRDVISAAIVNAIAVGSQSDYIRESGGVTKEGANKLRYYTTESVLTMAHKENVRR